MQFRDRERMGDQERDAYTHQVIESVRAAEVMSLFFPTAMRSLILDMRRSLVSEPRILVDRIVTSPAARIQTFRRIRPEMPLPINVIIIPWSGYVMQLAETGVLEAIYERCRWEGDDALEAAARGCYQTLVTVERELRRELVFGAGMKTIWQRDLGKGKPSNI
jgi:hypothetical protein